jgi:hypothetical protein
VLPLAHESLSGIGRVGTWKAEMQRIRRQGVEKMNVAEGPLAGRYTALADGAVHVAFMDRTQLSLPRRVANGVTVPATAILPDGISRTLSLHLSLPEPLLSYLSAAQQFQEWAALSPAGRTEVAMQREERASMAAAEVAKTTRFLAMQSMERGVSAAAMHCVHLSAHTELCQSPAAAPPSSSASEAVTRCDQVRRGGGAQVTGMDVAEVLGRNQRAIEGIGNLLAKPAT